MTSPARIGRYVVLEYIAQGAMGVVYRGRDAALERDVALKVMSGVQGADDDAQARFKREAQAAGRLQHPNIITIYELGEHQGAPFIAMEFLEGVDLQTAIEGGLRPDPRVTLPIILQVLAGLHHAHEHGIVHRDIKPSNIFLPRGRPAKLMDFGVARLTTTATSTGVIVGTPNYMSPEQVRGQQADPRADVFSTGLILYELVTGERAYQAGTVVALMYKIANEAPDLSLLPAAPEWARLGAVVRRALERQPANRYPNARIMAADLGEALVALGGSPDWASASDRGLMARHTPRPAVFTPTGGTDADLGIAPTLEVVVEETMAARSPRPRPLPWGLLSAALLLLLAVASAAVSYWFFRPTSLGGASATPAATDLALPSAPPSVAAATATPAAARPGLTPPATPSIVAQKPPAMSSTPLGGQSQPPSPLLASLSTSERLARANALFEQGRYQSALREARAVLAREPANADAQTLAEDAEVALVVEERLRKAKDAMRHGDHETALEEVRLGLAASPTDARLLALFRQLTR
jgi:eukaryotic-like serine/threonine-protein kinase